MQKKLYLLSSMRLILQEIFTPFNSLGNFYPRFNIKSRPSDYQTERFIANSSRVLDETRIRTAASSV